MKTIQVPFVVAVALCLMAGCLFMAVIPVGTGRIAVMTDASGNVINTPLTFSNQVACTVAATQDLQLVRFGEFTNATQRITNSAFATTNFVNAENQTNRWTLGMSTNNPPGINIITTNSAWRGRVIHTIKFQSTFGATNSLKLVHVLSGRTNNLDEWTIFNQAMTNVATLKGPVDVSGILCLSNFSSGAGTILYITNGYNLIQE